MPYTAFFQDDDATFSMPRSQQQQRLSLRHRHPLSPQEKSFPKNYMMDDYMSMQEDNEMFKEIDAPILENDVTKNINSTTNTNTTTNNVNIVNGDLLLQISPNIEKNNISNENNIKKKDMLFIPNSSNNMFLSNTNLTDISRNSSPVVITSPRQKMDYTPLRQYPLQPNNVVQQNGDLQLPMKNIYEDSISRTNYFEIQNHVNANHVNSNKSLEDLLVGSNFAHGTLSPTQMYPSLKDTVSPGLNISMTNHKENPFNRNSETNEHNRGNEQVTVNDNTSENNLSFKHEYSETHSETSSQSPPVETIHIRMLVSDDEASRVIGLKGQCLFKLRDEYDVEISISKHEKNCSDRILFCGGHINNVSNAIKGIINILIDSMTEDLRNKNHSFPFLRSMLKKPQLSEFNNVSNILEIYSIRLIVSNSQLSSIIGKNGHTIKSLIPKYNIKIIASNRFLPDSDERVLEIQGTSNNIADSIVEIGQIIYHRGLNIEYFGERHYYPHIISPNKPADSRNKSTSGNSQHPHHHSNSGSNLAPTHSFQFGNNNNINNDNNINNTPSKNNGTNNFNNPTINRTKSNSSNSSYSSSTCSITSSIISKENKTQSIFNSNNINKSSTINKDSPFIKDDPNDLSSYMFTASIEFPDKLVAAMMGIKGNRISNLRNLTKTKITLERYVDTLTRQDMARFIVKSRNRTNVKKANSILKKNLNTELKRLEQNV